MDHMVRSCLHVSCHFIIITQLLLSNDFSYNLILKPNTLTFIHSECLIQFLFPKQ